MTVEEELAELKTRNAQQTQELEGLRVVAAQKSTDAAWLRSEMAVAGMMLGVAYDGLTDLNGLQPDDREQRQKALFQALEMAMVDIAKSQKRQAPIDMLKYADLAVVVSGMAPVGTPQRPRGGSDSSGLMGGGLDS